MLVRDVVVYKVLRECIDLTRKTGGNKKLWLWAARNYLQKPLNIKRLSKGVFIGDQRHVMKKSNIVKHGKWPQNLLSFGQHSNFNLVC